MRIAPILLAVALAVGLFRPADAAGVLATFTVLGPDGAVARAIVDGASCPAIEIDGKSAAMRVRAAADARFPLVCDALVPRDARRARIGDHDLPLLAAAPRRIAVFGDSGCRVDARAGEFQPCNDEAKWPFARTSAVAAGLHPDLVIHVGDYLYRESACPPAYGGCAGSPSGDAWPAWNADFFAPAAPLLAAAPWVIVRGNHEECARSGTGFFRLLDPQPLEASCPVLSHPYTVDAKSLALVLFDSAAASDTAPSPARVERYRREFALMRAPAGAWFLTHRPVWGVVRVSNAIGLSLLLNDNETLQQASGNKLPGIALVLSGHIHLFEALGFADRRPPQLILGTAGSSLSEAIGSDVTGREIGGTTIAYGRTAQQFGVTTLERKGDGWSAVLRDASGAVRLSCTIDGPAVACAP